MPHGVFPRDPPCDQFGYEGSPTSVELLYAPLAVLATRHDGVIDWFRGFYRVDGECVLTAEWRRYGSIWYALGWRQPGSATARDMVNLAHPPRDVRQLRRVRFE